MAATLKLDITRMMADAVGSSNGASMEEIESYWPKVTALLEGLDAKRKAGELPFYDLPDQQDAVDRINEFSEKARARYKNVVILGIGGSALGAIALRDALKPLEWNSRSDDQRNAPRLFVPDNSDPEYLSAVMDLCDPSETLYNVITKSGGTAETMASYLSVLTQVKEKLGEGWKDHIVFTTDPSKGNLRKIARNEGITAFSIPAGVGGRFSVLTSVGLLPAALLGIDIKRLLAGAAEQREHVFKPGFDQNASAAFALLQYLAQTVRNQNVHVVMPYSNALFRTADWFRQLWAESLGKRESLEGSIVSTGPTPVAALGATDQHSQVQLYVEGPSDKTFTFIFVDNYRASVKAGKHYPDVDSIDYLAGLEMGDLIKAEAEATQRAVTAAQRPNMAFHLSEVCEETVGGLMYLFEAATLVAGGLYGVNPLDQPGVEMGKKATYALLGRQGFEDIRNEIEKERKRKPYLIG